MSYDPNWHVESAKYAALGFGIVLLVAFLIGSLAVLVLLKMLSVI